MRLYAPLIKSVRYKFLRIRINTSYQTVLKCFDVFADDLIGDFDRIDVCLYLLVRARFILRLLTPKHKFALFDLIYKRFIDAPNKKAEGEKHFDFNQDAGFIYSSFLQCYHNDLVGKDRKLHWWSFIALFSGLSDDTKIVQIMSIRSRPLPKPTKFNAEERRQLMKLKHLYRLELSEGERKQQFQKGLAKVAIALQGLAQR